MLSEKCFLVLSKIMCDTDKVRAYIFCKRELSYWLIECFINI